MLDPRDLEHADRHIGGIAYGFVMRITVSNDGRLRAVGAAKATARGAEVRVYVGTDASIEHIIGREQVGL